MTDAHLRQFLLRRLPADEAARLEDAILLEEGVAERLRDEELDLLDDYAASRLNAADAADVELHLLGSADNVHSLRVARALQGQRARYAEPKSLLGERIEDEPSRAQTRGLRSFTKRRSRTPQIARVAALLAACVVAVVVIPRWRLVASRPEVASTVIDTRSGASSALSGVSSDPASDLPIVSLVADVNRGSARPSLTIAGGATAVRLQVEVPEQAEAGLFCIQVNDAKGQRLFASNALELHSAGPYRFVEAVVPVSALGPGDRTILLTGFGAADTAPVKFKWETNGAVVSREP